MHVQALGGHAHLPGGEERPPDQALEHLVGQRCVLEHHRGVVAAELQHHRRDVPGSRGGHGPGHRPPAGERHLAHQRVTDEGLAHLDVTVDHREHAGREQLGDGHQGTGDGQGREG